MPINFEFKAASGNIDEMEARLQVFQPLFAGSDHQVDTYFNVPMGRLKLREGTIENALIYYERPNLTGAKISSVCLYQHQHDANLKEALVRAMGIKVVVNKIRKIFFIDNVKFHFDHVHGLGNFIEVEAIDKNGAIGIEKLKEQCDFYAEVLQVREEDYISISYSDMLMDKYPHPILSAG